MTMKPTFEKNIKDSLLKKFEAIGENDFEFVKVRQKKNISP